MQFEGGAPYEGGAPDVFEGGATFVFEGGAPCEGGAPFAGEGGAPFQFLKGVHLFGFEGGSPLVFEGGAPFAWEGGAPFQFLKGDFCKTFYWKVKAREFMGVVDRLDDPPHLS